MIQTLRQIKGRIKSIETTRKITRAMEMVSASKLKRIQSILESSKHYFDEIGSLLGGLSLTPQDHIFLRPHAANLPKTLCVVTSDTGLCSSYNQRLLQAAEQFIRKEGSQPIQLYVIGRKGFNYFRSRNIPIAHSFLGLQGRLTDEIIDDIFQKMTENFISGKTGEVQFAYTRFKSILRYTPTVEKFLPVSVNPVNTKEYVFEPPLKNILNKLIPVYLKAKIRYGLLHSFTSEQSARMIAMRTATENARELLDQFILMRNKARQAAITKEIIEIVSAAEALRG